MTYNGPNLRRAGRHLIVLSHPSLKSFNHSIAEAYRNAVQSAGGEVIVRDLYAIGFDPVLKEAERPGPQHKNPTPDVADEIELIRRNDVLVLVYPIWFGGAPAILKGYVDRVLGFDVVPDAIRAGLPSSLLEGKSLLSFTTSATSELWLDEQGQQASLKTTFDRYLARAFGMELAGHVHFGHITADLPDRFSAQYLQEVGEKAQSVCSTLEHTSELAEVVPS